MARQHLREGRMEEVGRTGGLAGVATQEEVMVEGEGVRWEPLGVDMGEEVGCNPQRKI